MRLDIFLPALRKAKPGGPVRRRPWAWVARRVLPGPLFSDSTTKQRGFLRRGLRFLGMTWLSSPARRVVQALCFGAFLYFFFYVCWPYSARPARSWRGATPAEVDAGTGQVTIVFPEALDAMLAKTPSVHVADEGTGTSIALGEFRVVARSEKSLTLAPMEVLSAEKLDELSLSVGPWTISERRPDAWPSHYADELSRKDFDYAPAESFLAIDPLVALSTSLAARSWVWSLACAVGILLACVFIPRGFCGYLCPLGTLIDLFDWAIGKRVTRFRVPDNGWWVHIKYYLLLAVLVTSLLGVLTSGVVAAIPVLTRGMLFVFGPLQTGLSRGWHQMPPMNAGHYVSIALFLAVLGLGFLKPRFWCKYVCPSGAVFSLGNLFRVSERKVESSCIHCNKCVEICPFDAIKPDFTTRTSDCTLCQTCGGVCPTHAIKFVERWNVVELKTANDPPTGETALGRRGFLAASVGLAAGTIGGLAAAGAIGKGWGADLDSQGAFLPVRPPGSVPEREFLQMCIRCGECFKACPNDVLHALGFQQGLEGLWTPHVVADWAGCESSCNACGQVCPTGAIRALPLEEKKVCRMGLAIVNTKTCLPFAQREACQLCVDECNAAGYRAIEFARVGTQADEQGNPIEGTGFLAPVVLPDKCVGCGLCQTRCYGINVAEKGLLQESAIIVEAGEEKEDRLMSGSYIELRKAEQRKRAGQNPTGSGYLPDFLK
jgi:NAD-dependent dihydropyrimidine dehydrogenase PreA subunit